MKRLADYSGPFPGFVTLLIGAIAWALINLLVDVRVFLWPIPLFALGLPWSFLLFWVIDFAFDKDPGQPVYLLMILGGGILINGSIAYWYTVKSERAG